jgi:ribonuclease P protein component
MAVGNAPNGGSSLSSQRKPALSKASRLLVHADFERVYKQGKRHFAKHMTVFYLPRPNGGGARIGFTVGRALGGAVQRNRMKRRLREAVRLLGLAEAQVDIVVNPKKSLLQADFNEIKTELARAMQVVNKSSAQAVGNTK